jgi:hypothetical protein
VRAEGAQRTASAAHFAESLVAWALMLGVGVEKKEGEAGEVGA